MEDSLPVPPGKGLDKADSAPPTPNDHNSRLARELAAPPVIHWQILHLWDPIVALLRMMTKHLPRQPVNLLNTKFRV